jgi:hypothetical protein
MKPDAEQIRDFLDDLASQEWLGKLRSLWVKYSFHFTDIINAVQILQSGKIRCRADLEREDALPVDIASPEIILSTDGEVKDYVRLYFRPLTPTQFHMEGIRPKSELWKNCHCPVPVFFLFDSYQILSRDDSRFSEVNLAIVGKNQNLCSTVDQLRLFDFRQIFHQGKFSEDSKADIISHRNAEIVIPKELDLSSLKFIYCRTPAEKETLLHRLPPNIVARWGSRIIVASSANLFKRNWAFIETAKLDSKSATFEFSPEAQVAGPFEIRVVCRGKETKLYKSDSFYARGKLPIDFKTVLWRYEIEVFLDGHLAYAGKYDESDDIPF